MQVGNNWLCTIQYKLCASVAPSVRRLFTVQRAEGYEFATATSHNYLFCTVY